MDTLIIFVGGDGGQRRVAYFIVPAQVTAVEGIVPGRRLVLVDGMDAFGFEFTLRETVEYGEPGGLGAGRRALGHLTGEQLRAQPGRAQVENPRALPGYVESLLLVTAMDQRAHGQFFARPEQLAAEVQDVRPAVFIAGKQVLLGAAVSEVRY